MMIQPLIIVLTMTPQLLWAVKYMSTLDHSIYIYVILYIYMSNLNQSIVLIIVLTVTFQLP